MEEPRYCGYPVAQLTYPEDEFCVNCHYRKARHAGGVGTGKCPLTSFDGTYLRTVGWNNTIFSPSGFGYKQMPGFGFQPLARWDGFNGETKIVAKPNHFPHKCPGCGKPAYCGIAPADVDCSARCRPQYTKAG